MFLEQITHYKGFSACSKCKDIFRICADSENALHQEPLYEAIILFRIGGHRSDLKKLDVLGEYGRQIKMTRCCFLVELLSNDRDYGMSGILLDAIEPECASNVLRLSMTEVTFDDLDVMKTRVVEMFGRSISSAPMNPEEFRVFQKEMLAENQMDLNSAIFSGTKVAVKPRKSNKSRKSSKKKRLKNSF